MAHAKLVIDSSGDRIRQETPFARDFYAFQPPRDLSSARFLTCRLPVWVMLHGLGGERPEFGSSAGASTECQRTWILADSHLALCCFCRHLLSRAFFSSHFTLLL